MVLVRVRFRLGPKSWSLEFTADDGISLQHFKKVMLKGKGAPEELHLFELRKDGKRVPNHNLLWQDTTLDFKFLGHDRGLQRALRDTALATAAQSVGANPASISLENVLQLQADLMDGFSRPAFQKQLDELEVNYKDNERRFNAERQKLFLSVQKLVLPKWGFPGTAKGVFEMMQALAQQRFNNDPDFQRNGWVLNNILRLAPLGPMPAPPPPAVAAALQAQSAAPSISKDSLVKLQKELLVRYESAELRHSLETLAKTCGKNSPEFTSCADGMISHVHKDVFLKYGLKEDGLVGVWAAMEARDSDAEVRSLTMKLTALRDRLGLPGMGKGQHGAVATVNVAGKWSGSGVSRSKVYEVEQTGTRVRITCAEEPWSPAAGSLNDEMVITMDSPKEVKGYCGKLVGDKIMWPGEPWCKHVSTSVLVQHGPDSGRPAVSIEAPAGATAAWIKEELLRLCPDVRTRIEDLELFAADQLDQALKDEQVITPLLEKLHLKTQGPAELAEPAPKEEEPTVPPEEEEPLPAPLLEEEPQNRPQGPANFQAVEEPREQGNEEEPPESSAPKPGTPRTSSQMFDFHELDDF